MKRLIFVALILFPALTSQVVADDDKTVEALRSAADSLMSSKQYEEARRLYKTALDRYPKSKHGIDLVN